MTTGKTTTLSAISDGKRKGWSPIRSAIITCAKQNWMIVKCNSNLFLRVIITDGIGRHELLLQIYYENYSFRKENQDLSL